MELPYPENEGQTHYEGCWKDRGHHNCAVVEIESLKQQLSDARKGLTMQPDKSADTNFLYDMQLHEQHAANFNVNTVITRVPGGWIYRYERDAGVSSVFVPFNNEFQKP